MPTKPKLMSITEFAERAGGQERAAVKIGVSFTTVNRWRNKHDKPRGLSRARLLELGVDPDRP